MVEGLMNDIVSNSNIKVEECDYLKDDVWYCGKCNTPKQRVITIGGITSKVMMLCECKTIERDKYDEEVRIKDEQKRIRDMRSVGFSETEMKNWTFENDDKSNEKLTNIARNYVANFEKARRDGKGLLFFGSVGGGKSYISACIVNALIDKGISAMMTNFARLTNSLSDNYHNKQEVLDNLNNFDLVVIDDLATERNTEYMNELVFSIIDARYRNGKPLIITTNLTGNELYNPVSIDKQRIYSRLLEMCIPIEVKFIDRRKKNLKNDYNEYKNLLGI